MKIGKTIRTKAAGRGTPVQSDHEEPIETETPCIIVGIGASAGGQKALEQLFAGMPDNCNLSFLVIMHLPPEGPSFLAGMLSRYTIMEVLTAEEGTAPKPNKVYVIPAGRNLTVKHGCLHLEIPEDRHKAHHAIDHLLNSLSELPGERIVAVILSGSGNDGAQGVKRIKAAGGLVIVQAPASAEYPAMPNGVIETGAADLILPPAEIAEKIAEISRGCCSLSANACRIASPEENLATIIRCVKDETGHDFSTYKTDTVMRRIERRMTINHMAAAGKYIALLRNNPQEAHALNEELQSTNEELETSKEELQALNEELNTVNAELQEKVEELNQANSDMQNLLTSSEISTLFLDRQLNIKGFTPAAAAIFNLIPTDVHRPFRHFSGKIDCSSLTQDAEMVLAGLDFTEREVATLDCEYNYLERIFPYRTTQGQIDGIVITLVDITERKRAEEARMLLAAIVESSDDAIIAKDLYGVIRSWNSAASRLFGYTAAEAIGQAITLLVSPELHAEEDGIQQRLAAGERVEHYETVRIAKDGKQVDVSVTVSPIRDSGGKIIGASKIARDITERKRTSEALSQSLRQNESLVKIIGASSLPFGIGYPDGHLGLVNAAFEQLTGYSADELKLIDWNMVLTPPEWREIERQNLAKLQRTGQPVRYEKEYITKDSRRIPIELFVHLAKDSEGKPEYYYAFVTNISERKNSELALRQQEERLRLALAAARMATWDWHVPSGAVIWNEMHYRMMGYEPGEVQPSYQAWLNRVHPDDVDAVLSNIQHCMSEALIYINEFRTLWPDGTIHWLQARGEFEYGPDSQPLRSYGVMLDITERKQAEQALQDADRRKDEFLAMLAHELRNPLAPIRNAVEIQKLASADPSRINWCTEVIDRQIEHLTGLVDDLLDVSRISRGLVELKKEPLQIRDFILPAVETIQPLIDSRRQHFSMAMAPEAIWVEGDRIRLAQVISNLLNNATKYTQEGGHIELSAEPSGNDICIRVADNGCGIDPPALANLFDLFYQADRNLDRSQGGLGIGLSLVRSLVEKHGGQIQAFSAGRDQGSEFVVRLPRLMHAKPAEVIGTALSPPALKKLRILVVDDNRDIAESLAMLLEIEGYPVQTANDGPAALEIARAELPDAILLDIGLPEMDGYAVAQELRRIEGLEGGLLIALTGYGQPEDLKKSRAAGFDQHLVKPANIETLVKLLDDFQAGRS